jgi:hypothetical protein
MYAFSSILVTGIERTAGAIIMHLESGGDDSSSIAQIRDENRTEEIDLVTEDVTDNCSVCDYHHLRSDHTGMATGISNNQFRDDVNIVTNVVSDAEIIVVSADVERSADS